MSKTKKMALGVHLLLFSVALFIGAVCLFPAAAFASAKESVFRNGDRSGKGVSLLINVYWGTKEVQEMLDILDEHGAKATFFIGGAWADDNAACLKEIVSRGHEVGSHGYFHKDCAGLSKQKTAEEIELSRQLILLTTGVDITLFAPPSGSYDATTVQVCEEAGLKMILWSKDTVDWRDKNAELTFERATKGVTGGEFVLMHPMQETVKALPRILDYYENNGLKTVTVTENISYDGRS